MTTNTRELTGRKAFEKMVNDRERYGTMLDYLEENPASVYREGNQEVLKEISIFADSNENGELRDRAKRLLIEEDNMYSPKTFFEHISNYGLSAAWDMDKWFTETRLKHSSPRLYQVHSIAKAFAKDAKKTVGGKAGKFAYVTAYPIGLIAGMIGEGTETIESLDSRLNSNREKE